MSSDSFDSADYLERYPEVEALGLSAREHFEQFGKRLGYVTSTSYSGTQGQSEPNDKFEAAWKDGFNVALGGKSPFYVPLATTCFSPKIDSPKTIAFYLPQFHPIAQNDAWWGQGFTEWTNVTKAQPQFVGHVQPRLPGELGFYDLRVPDVMKRQIELAKQYGIGGFCFHYYWFAGQRLLERPLEDFLADKSASLDFPFCLCWANENWTRAWDGAEADVLIAQRHSVADNQAVFEDLVRFFQDKRYILVEGKPMIVIYRPTIIESLNSLVTVWRAAALKAGFNGIYLVTTNSFGCDSATAIGFDALVEFPPHGIASEVLNDDVQLLNPDFQGQIYEYEQVVDFSLNRLAQKVTAASSTAYFPTLMMGWDNEARKPGKGHVFHDASPGLFQRWMNGALKFCSKANPQGAQFVFINAWNEWAEGTYLEPDRHFGYAYLTAVRDAYLEFERHDRN